MRRRDLAAALCAVICWPLAARAQRTTVPHVGLLFFETPDSGISRKGAAFRQAMQTLGWMEGSTVSYHHRYAAGQSERLTTMAAELAALLVDVIVCFGTQATQAARSVTGAIPIVMAGVRDPVGSGFVATLARPGGNITGTSLMLTDIGSKHIELLHEAVPQLKRLGIIVRQGYSAHFRALPSLRATASGFGIEAHTFIVSSGADLASTFEALSAAKIDAILVLANPHLDGMRGRLAELALARRMASMGQFREYTEDGFLLSYAVSLPQAQGRAATYVDRILKGAKPGDLPVEQPTKFELVINLKTAKALGFAFPAAMLVRADDVIE